MELWLSLARSIWLLQLVGIVSANRVLLFLCLYGRHVWIFSRIGLNVHIFISEGSRKIIPVRNLIFLRIVIGHIGFLFRVSIHKYFLSLFFLLNRFQNVFNFAIDLGDSFSLAGQLSDVIGPMLTVIFGFLGRDIVVGKVFIVEVMQGRCASSAVSHFICGLIWVSGCAIV